MPDFATWLLESFQSGGPRGVKRSKSDEMEIAKLAPIYKKLKIGKWSYKSTIHAAAQSYDRRPDMEFNDWKTMHIRAYAVIDKMSDPAGDYIVYSKSFDQAYVIVVDTRINQIRVITVLPKGRKNPKPGTELLIVEYICNERSELIEID